MKKIGVNMDWFKSSRGKKTEDYEKGYLTRCKKGQKAKPKKKRSKDNNSIETESNETNQENVFHSQRDLWYTTPHPYKGSRLSDHRYFASVP